MDLCTECRALQRPYGRTSRSLAISNGMSPHSRNRLICRKSILLKKKSWCTRTLLGSDRRCDQGITSSLSMTSTGSMGAQRLQLRMQGILPPFRLLQPPQATVMCNIIMMLHDFVNDFVCNGIGFRAVCILGHSVCEGVIEYTQKIDSMS